MLMRLKLPQRRWGAFFLPSESSLRGRGLSEGAGRAWEGRSALGGDRKGRAGREGGLGRGGSGFKRHSQSPRA